MTFVLAVFLAFKLSLAHYPWAISSLPCTTVVSHSFPLPFLFLTRTVVLCIVLVAGFWLAVAETLPVAGSLPSNYDVAELRDNVQFGYGYYIYLAAGVFSLIAACLNLLRARTAAERRRNLRHRLR